jgi:hypothetical protein
MPAVLSVVRGDANHPALQRANALPGACVNSAAHFMIAPTPARSRV